MQINVTSELFSRGWLDGFIFINSISVNATNSTNHVMLFSFEYSDDIGTTFREYDANGIHVGITFFPGRVQNVNSIVTVDANVTATSMFT